MSRGSARDSGRPGVQQEMNGATENSHRSHLRQEHSAISGVLWGQMEEVYEAFLASGSHPLWRAENEDFKWHDFKRGLHQLSPKGYLNYMDPVAARE